ncbi:MAG TPA: isochorismatase family cysteine hydrolase [Chloroflexota bacterium]|nr:isochorismatase family cysteine hydrolase [Chloroflexota bacterium]
MRGSIPWQPPRPDRYTIAELAIEPRATALLLLDLQVAHLDPERGLGRRLRATPAQHAYYYTRVAEVVLPNVARLQAFFRAHRLPIVYTRLGLLTADGRELASWSWHAAAQRVAGDIPPRYPPGAPERELWPSLAPRPDELVLDKSTLSPFNSTMLDQYLRNMGVENLVIAGVLTDAAVETTARSAGDRGYNTIVVEDACAALAAEHHTAALATASWYVCKRTDEVLAQLGALLETDGPR